VGLALARAAARAQTVAEESVASSYRNPIPTEKLKYWNR
jgi:hypothetical protein